jgi:hypothetical protein
MNNEEYWLERIQQQANRLTKELSKLAGRFSFSEDTYKRLGLSNKLGEVPEFYDLGNISNMVHIPIPFLERENYYKRSNDNNELYLVTESNLINRFDRQRDIFRLVFGNLAFKMLQLIDFDLRNNNNS